MPTMRPPRREPRVLALAATPHGLQWAVADPWEVRGAGKIPCRSRSNRLAVVKLLRREKPTAMVCGTTHLLPLVTALGRIHRVPVVREGLPTLDAGIAEELYPEALMRAPNPSLLRLASLAISAVLHADIPSRRYAPCRRRALCRDR